jgi:hypothetical protein
MQSFVTVADSLPGFAVPEVKERLEKWNVKQVRKRCAPLPAQPPCTSSPLPPTENNRSRRA